MSSPLILSFNMSDSAKMDRVWPIITNTRVIAVNQQWVGSPGRRISLSAGGLQVWAKPMGEEAFAVFLMNGGEDSVTASLPLQNVSHGLTGSVCLRDLYTGKVLPELKPGTPLVAALPVHDSVMFCAWPSSAQGSCSDAADVPC